MKHTIGLDIGTNSIGWVLLHGNEIVDKGVNIFPIGTNLKKGIQEESKNSQRGGFRRTKRNLFRYKLRRKQLRKYLKDNKMLPDFNRLYKLKGSLQASDLYELRAKALDSQIPIDEIGRIFLLINKHRGFKSNSKTLSENKEDEEGKVKEGIKQIEGFMDNTKSRTIGEYFHKMYNKAKERTEKREWHNADEPYDERAKNPDGHVDLHKNRGIRRENGRYVARQMYENEFDLIWEKQRTYYRELTGSKAEYDAIRKLTRDEKRRRLIDFKETLYWKIKYYTLFYQRPLKSQKKFIGKCAYEKNKGTAPVSSLLFQEFRIWKQLADVRYSDSENGIQNSPLPKEWKQKIMNYLQKHDSLPLKTKTVKGIRKTDLLDLLKLNRQNIEFNFDNEEEDKVFHGNKTLYGIYTAIGEDLFNDLISNSHQGYAFKNLSQIEALWHTLYMAKDDEWLKDTLLFTWNFDENTADNLIDMGLEDGFASYSTKVLKKLLPFMKDGKDEFDAKVLAGYEKAPDEVKDKTVLKEKISPLRNNELRNPVVEKAVSQTIKLVNAIILNHKYNVDKEDLTIRIESTREFKKPKKERENIRRGNTETDKKRLEYAAFLNEKRKEGKLNFNREIYKYDSIINKFELWLEMGMDENDISFAELKNNERDGREKHKLWLECNRICPYSGNVINLSKLFSSDIEIEHIIPYSRSLNDSFHNKTITFSEENKKKADQTAYEYMMSKGPQAFSDFKKRLKSFRETKKDQVFLKEKVEAGFTSNQITNTSYIATYVRKKLQEICRDVQFSNGFATGELRKNDWKLGSILDKVRYEEETEINIDSYYTDFYLFKADFEAWRRRKANSTDLAAIKFEDLSPENTAEYEAENNNPLHEWWKEIEKFEGFRGEKGKKDRSDHRHHLLDAIIIACCSRSIVQELSTLSAAREKQGYAMYDGKGRVTRETIPCPLSYDQIKAALKDVLVYHKAEQKLLTSKINKIRKRTSINGEKFTVQKTNSVRGALFGENYYGKLKNPAHQGFEKGNVFVKRVELNKDNFKDEKSLEKVVDKNLREILKKRILKYGSGDKAFSKEALLKDPVSFYSLSDYPNGTPENPTGKNGNPLPVIKKVRIANKNVRNLVQLKAINEDKSIAYENRYAETDGNYIMALYESRETDKKGKVKVKRDFEILSFYEAVERKRRGDQLFPDEKLLKDGSFLPLMKNCPYLKSGDMVIMFQDNEDKIDWENKGDLNRRLYQITELSSFITKEKDKEYLYGLIKFVKHNVSKVNADYKGLSYKKDVLVPMFKNTHKQINAIKVRVSITGEIVNAILREEISEMLL